MLGGFARPALLQSQGVRRLVLLLIAVAALGACDQAAPECVEFCGGTVRGVFRIGDQTIPDSKWIEMIQLSGPPNQRCGPGDCGVVAGAMRVGVKWNPGRWRVIPPHVSGWETPGPIEITVREDESTIFELNYLPE
jgi:hypothetical protein